MQCCSQSLQEEVTIDYDVTECVNAGNSFFSDDGICLENYRELYDSKQITVVAQSICASQSCRSRLGDFVSYLRACDDFGSDSVCKCKHVFLIPRCHFAGTVY